MKKILLGLLTLVAVISLAACNEGGASNVFDFILDESFDEFIVMETSADYPPFENIEEDADGNMTVVGVDIEIAKAIAMKAGKNLRVVHKGFDFLITDIQNGVADFSIAAITPTPERMEQVDFSNIYLPSENDQVVVINKTDADLYKTIEDINLATIKVGAQLGSLQQYLLQDLTPDAVNSAQIIQDLNTLYTNLANGQIDALYSEITVAETHIAQDAYKDLMIAFEVDSPYAGNAVAVQKGDTELLAIINSAIAELIADGQIETWVDEYSALYE